MTIIDEDKPYICEVCGSDYWIIYKGYIRCSFCGYEYIIEDDILRPKKTDKG